MIRNVRVLPRCILCGLCDDLCPEVFHVRRTCRVIGKAEDFEAREETLRALRELCPVRAIELDERRSSARGLSR